jgi:hypothetical protein
VPEQIVERLGEALDRRMSRRGALSRLIVAACAFAVAPLRYLLRPVSAWAVITRPADCSSGSRCNDGWTAFCCEVTGGLNTCPENSYIAGWWKCTDYRGSQLCADTGARYYVDCNRVPGRHFSGGCHCAHGDCNRRRVDCNHFRYGQCNTQVAGTTEVVCRLVVCDHPAKVASFNCNSTYKQDNRTCGHEAPCLTRSVVQLPGAGGA